MRSRKIILLAVLLCVLIVAYWLRRLVHAPRGETHAPPATTSSAPVAPKSKANANPLSPTSLYAHNLMLRKGPDFRVYVRWLRGQLGRSKPTVNPTFDDPESFYLYIKTGVLRANIGDLSHYLNAGIKDAPLRNITLSGDGDQIKLKGTLQRVLPLPIELDGTISALPENRIRVHVNKLNVLKIPVKALLGGLHIQLSDLFKAQSLPGVQVAGSDIFFDTQQLLPPPHIRGELTKVRIVNPDLEEVYGDAESDVARVEQWRNFLRLQGGTIDFGKLTMRNVDIVMVDLSNDAWFDLDLNKYQDQLVNGYTRMTPQAGLQIFMPDLDTIPAAKRAQNVSLEWMKHRNAPPPADVYSK